MVFALGFFEDVLVSLVELSQRIQWNVISFCETRVPHSRSYPRKVV